ncbi:hypothetical protein PENSPDRAFT_228827 [Peniophora sp. CONT]|nr:hypothetical protein PENSPDRAFT_228827 [Peniophora sp. CONT]
MSSLSADDAATLHSIGVDAIQSFVALFVEAVLYTVYIVLVLVAGRILLRRNGNWKSVVAFGILFTMLLLDTTFVVIDVNNAIREITMTIMSDSAISLTDRYNNIVLPWPVESAVYAFMSNLGDAIIIWRVHVFWNEPGERWVIIFPLVSFLGSIVTSVLLAYCVAELNADPLVPLGDILNPPFCRHSQLASYITALITTAVATLMIGYKTWIYRKEVGAYLRSSSSSRTRIEKTMIILTESGFLYFLFFLSAVVADIGDLPSRETSTPQLAFASNIWTYMTSHILGIYPALIVILVHTQRSYISGNDFTLSTIYFSGESDQAKGESDASHAGRLKHTVPAHEHEARAGHFLDIHVPELHCGAHQSSARDGELTTQFTVDIDTPVSKESYSCPGE